MAVLTLLWTELSPPFMMNPQSPVYLKMGSTKRQDEVVRVGVSETVRLVSLQKTPGKLSLFLSAT